MCEARILDVIRRVIAADLPSATESVAFRLILRASPDVGQVNLTWDEFTALVGCDSKGNARRHLINLAKHKLIHYSINDNVYVTWLAWLMEDMDYDPYARAKNARGRSKNARTGSDFAREDSEEAIRAKNARERSENARERSENARTGSDFVTLSSSSSSSETDSEYAFREDLVSKARQMLRECGIYPADAERLSQDYPFEILREHIFTWRNDKTAKGPGSLKHRIEHNFNRSPLTAEDRKTLLYWKYRTPEEQVEPEPAEPQEEEEPATPSQTPLPAMPAAEPNLWQRLLSDLEMTMPVATFKIISAATQITETDNELFLSVPAFAMTMMDRLRTRIQRDLKQIAGKHMALRLVEEEAAHAH